MIALFKHFFTYLSDRLDIMLVPAVARALAKRSLPLHTQSGIGMVGLSRMSQLRFASANRVRFGVPKVCSTPCWIVKRYENLLKVPEYSHS